MTILWNILTHFHALCKIWRYSVDLIQSFFTFCFFRISITKCLINKFHIYHCPFVLCWPFHHALKTVVQTSCVHSLIYNNGRIKKQTWHLAAMPNAMIMDFKSMNTQHHIERQFCQYTSFIMKRTKSKWERLGSAVRFHCQSIYIFIRQTIWPRILYFAF